MGDTEQTTQKQIRCSRFVKEVDQVGRDQAKVNPRYWSSVPKEELLLEHVRQFERQFLQVYGERFLFLCPPNEFGVPKFLPTTVRPTHLVYRELYDLQTCTLFLADFLNYETLTPPNRYPTVMPSPASVLQWRSGDSFDFAAVLASMLLGVGYDAYCVSGFAPRYVALRNETRQGCPRLRKKEIARAEPDREMEVLIEKRSAAKSSFQANRASADEKARELEELEALKSDSDDDASSCADEYEDERIHCWVLVRKGSREVAEDLFVEPTTGRVYPVAESPYLFVDLIWNHRNLWVNMQQIAASKIQLDLASSKYFEYVLCDDEALQGPAGVLEEVPDLDKRPDDMLLEVPSSWSERLEIPRGEFAEKCYKGEKTVLYEKCKVETYAPYAQVDGMVERTTKYKDLRRQVPVEIVEKFYQRCDHLRERIRRPLQNELIERFSPGRHPPQGLTALKEFQEVGTVRRELRYYHTSRIDGLVETVDMLGKKIYERFEGRDDLLTYHSVTFAKGVKEAAGFTMKLQDGDDAVPIRKMTRKYARNPAKSGPQYQKVVFFVIERKIRVDYHCQPGMVTYHVLMLHKDEDNSKLEVEQPASSSCPLPTAQQLSELLEMENECKRLAVKQAERMYDELKKRTEEENKIRAWRSIEGEKDPDARESREAVVEHDVYYRAAMLAREAKSREVEEEQAEEAAQKIDILAPYIVGGGHLGTKGERKVLEAMDAEIVAKKCKNDFRHRLLDRAAIIQKRLEEEQDSLRKRRAQMQRRGDSADKDEGLFEQYQADAMFRISILEQRLARHETLAIKKFSELEKMLEEDPRLEAMWSK